MSDFVHLHLHTQYSLLDGAIRLKELMEQAKAFGMPAVAMTDHGNLFGAIEFYETAKSYGLKPIIGCEVYLANDHKKKAGKERLHHLVLLAENLEGYRHLLKLVSLSFLEGFYYKPRLDKELLAQYASGLIGLSACLQGEIPSLLLQDNQKAAQKALSDYLDIFGKGHFYLELQANGLPEQQKVNQALFELAQKYDVPVVATNDCHYLKKEDAFAHEILLCIQTGKTINDKNRMRFPNSEFYFKSPQEMKTIFKDLPQAINNTLEVAERCQLEMPFGEYHFPVFPVPEGESLESLLRKKATQGLEQRLNQRNIPAEKREAYWKRLEYELGIICQMGFPGYFLIVADFINYAKRKGIPVGPGRGSAAGSLVAYAIGITEIDPLPYGLLFERFLNPERKSMPDIDTDICMARREEVIKYVSRKYGGKQHVAQIITFGKMQARAVVRDVGRALGMSYQEVDRIAKLVPPILNITLEEAIQTEPRLKELAENNSKVKQLLEIAKALEGLPRHASTHAAGVVISDDKPLDYYLPLYRGTKGEVVTQFDMKGVEKVGLIKFDFLGLKTLTLIDKCLKLIKTHRGEKLDLSQIPLDDKQTYNLLCKGDTAGVFQLESSGMRDLLRRLKPSRFEDLIALIALYRPGPIESGMVDDFINRKHGKTQVTYPLPQLEPILKETYGVILYQEQVMRIAVDLAGYTLGQADILRKAMGKKKPELMAAEKSRFVEGAVKNGIDRKLAEDIFDKIEKFAGYGFNKSHSTAYALIAYRTAFLKAHYPLEFMAALLSCEMSNMDEVVKYVLECQEKGIEVLPPDINKSELEFSVEGDKIRFALAAIKNVGTTAVPYILKARLKGPFKSFTDFCERVDLKKVNKRVIEALIKAGAFDSLGYKRSQLIFSLQEVMESAQKKAKNASLQMCSLFNFDHNNDSSIEDLPDVEEWDDSTKLAYEKEALGFYFSGHPLKAYEALLKEVSNTNTEELKELADRSPAMIGGMVSSLKEINSRKGERMAFVTLEDLRGKVEVVVFSNLYSQVRELLHGEQPIFVIGQVSKDEEASKIIADKICLLEEAKEQLKSIKKSIKKTTTSTKKNNHYKVVIYLDEENITRDDLLTLKSLLTQHHGTSTVFFKLIPSQTIIRLPDYLRVNPTKAFNKAIEGLSGVNRIKIEELHEKNTSRPTLH